MKYYSAREVSNMGVPYTVVLEACQNGALNAQRLGPAFAISESYALPFVADYKTRNDPNGAAPLRARIKELEGKVIALGGSL